MIQNDHQLYKILQIQSQDPSIIQYLICIFCAIISAFVISPIVTIVDKSVIQSANGKGKLINVLLEEIKKFLLDTPKLWKNIQFRWIFTVYVLTYATSNLSTKFLENSNNVDPLIGKLILTFIVNSTASIIKDKSLAQKLGKTNTKKFPISTLGLFFTRDLLAMSSAFTIPYFMSSHLQKFTILPPSTVLSYCQLISPAQIQIVTTFIQLLALDFYNRQNKNFIDRLKQVQKRYLSSLLTRMIGFTFAYGIGGLVNIQAKKYLQGKF